MKTYPQEVQSTTKYAKVLFLLCVLVLIAIWFLNRTISENELQYKAREDWYDETGSMLGKIRAYRAKNSSLFENLVVYALTGIFPSSENERKYPSLIKLGEFTFWHDTVDGKINSWKPGWKGGGGRPLRLSDDDLSFEELRDSAEVFGRKASLIVAKTKNNERRMHFLTEAVLASFKNSEASRFLIAEKIITRMSKIDDIEEWPGIAGWIVFSEWPPKNGWFGSTGPGISYADRFSHQWNSLNESFHIYKQLRSNSDPVIAEAIIESSWQNAYTDLKQTPTTVAKVSFTGIGLSVSANDILMLAGPVLIFFQVLFLILWERQNSRMQSMKDSEKPFIFPIFACPRDPLQSPGPKDLSEWAQRLIWMLFLIMPTMILLFGIFTRYDFYTFKTNYSYFVRGDSPWRSWFELLSYLRSQDFLSRFLDILNLACLAVSLLVLTNITSPPTKIENKKSSHAIRMARVEIAKHLLVLAIALICFFTWLVRLRKINPSSMYANIQDLFYFTIFGLLCLVFFKIALERGAKMVTGLSLIGIILFLLLFF